MGKHALVYTLLLTSLTNVKCLPNYWSERAAILQAESFSTLGGRLQFADGERTANDVLMTEKMDEIKKGFLNPSKFAPARNFLDAKSDIEKSKVFRIIRKVPKGAVLHAHDTAIVSDEFIFENITHRDNLYVCEIGERIGDKLAMRFFRVPDKNCDWQLLSDLRVDPKIRESIDQRIRSQLSMHGDKSSRLIYGDGNAAWKKFTDIFLFVTPFLTYKPVYEDHYYQGLQELYDDNVIYLELRSTLPTIYDLDGTEYGPIDLARIYKNVTDRFRRNNPKFIGAKLIYAPIKTNDPQEFDKFLDIATQLKRELPDFFAGFDLVGQEDNSSPLIQWADKIRAADGDMKFFFHAGETNWNGLGVDENLLDAVLLGSKRIGHGYALTKHPRVLDMAKKKKIAIEICPISNQVLALVEDMRNHPASELFVDDVAVVVSNDDPGLWGARALSYDFYEAFMGIMSAHADLRALKQLAMNSLYYSSMNDTEKNQALTIWQQQWDEFLNTFSSPNKYHETLIIVKQIFNIHYRQ